MTIDSVHTSSALDAIEPGHRYSWRATLHRVHVIAGIFIAPFLLIAAITGFLYAFAPSLEKVIYQEEMSAPAAAEGKPALPIAQQVAAAEAERPGEHATAIQIAADSQHSNRVMFKDPQLISSSYRHAVFVDPGDASIRGDLVQYGSSAALPFRAWLSEGHRRLWLGDVGRIYSETAASWMGALTLMGLWLWWDRNRGKRTGSTTRRARFMRWHSWTGTVLAAGFLFLTVTGLTWSMVAGADITAVREKAAWVAPTPETTVSAQAAPAASSTGVDWSQADTVLSQARAEGLTGKLELTAPTKPGQAWTAKEARQEWRTDMNTITVDGRTGQVVDQVRWQDWPIMAKFAEWFINAHMGILFGWVNQLVLGITALGLTALIVWGWLMWFARARRGHRVGSLPSPVGLRRIPPLFVVCCILYSLVAPLFGLSFLLFLLLDGGYRALTRGRR
ncbi:PepSY domain-containing protein [Corynebacterium sp. 3HC-13]|nr:PepSY domain-containing protein [Corynebacterium poyangense]